MQMIPQFFLQPKSLPGALDSIPSCQPNIFTWRRQAFQPEAQTLNLYPCLMPKNYSLPNQSHLGKQHYQLLRPQTSSSNPVFSSHNIHPSRKQVLLALSPGYVQNPVTSLYFSTAAVLVQVTSLSCLDHCNGLPAPFLAPSNPLFIQNPQ